MISKQLIVLLIAMSALCNGHLQGPDSKSSPAAVASDRLRQLDASLLTQDGQQKLLTDQGEAWMARCADLEKKADAEKQKCLLSFKPLMLAIQQSAQQVITLLDEKIALLAERQQSRSDRETRDQAIRLQEKQKAYLTLSQEYLVKVETALLGGRPETAANESATPTSPNVPQTSTASTKTLATQQPSGLPTKNRRPTTLGDFRLQFLNQRVVISDVRWIPRGVQPEFKRSYCRDWKSARQNSDGSYEAFSRHENQIANMDYMHLDNLPFKYVGQTGTVIAVQLASDQGTREGATNAFGESLGEEDFTNPYMAVIVKFDDESLGIIRGYRITLVPYNMEHVSDRQSLKDEIESKLLSVIGRKLYAAAYSDLYKPTATIDELTELYKRMSARLTVPLLEPLTIAKAKYLADVNAVLMKVVLPNGTEAIAYTECQHYCSKRDPQQDFLSRISGSLLPSIPPILTSQEVQAIKSRTLFRGMSAEAVDCAIGFSESKNDWGRGGKQLAYFHSKLLVYIDRSGKVVDWQRFE